MPNLYFAGPDVFSPDYARRIDLIRELCAVAGLVPFLPGDVEHDDSLGIYTHNLELIRKADGVIANLDPFRGAVEPDSGTVFECGYALALGKMVIGVVSDQRDLVSKLKDRGAGFDEATRTWLYEGTQVEDFGLPLNLMLSHSLTATVSTVQLAVAEARKRLGTAAV